MEIDFRRLRLSLTAYAGAVLGHACNSTGATVTTVGNVQVSDGEAIRSLAVAGVGLSRLAEFLVREDIIGERLVTVLEDHNPCELEEVHAVYLGQGGHLPARVRAFLDFLSENMQVA